MKTIFLFITMLAVTLSTDAQALFERKIEHEIPVVEIPSSLVNKEEVKSLAETLGEIRGIESVYISKSLLSQTCNIQGGLPLLRKDVKNMDCIYIFNSKNNSLLNQRLKTVAETYMKSHKYEKLMEQKEEKEMMSIMMKDSGNGSNEYVLLTYDSRETSVIIMIGSIKPDDFWTNIRLLKPKLGR